MRAGPLRHRVRIEQPQITLDDAGAPLKGWLIIGEVQAEISSVSGRESFNSQQADMAEVTTRIYLRVLPGIDVDAEVRITDIDSGAIYDAVAVLPDNRGVMLTIAAKRGSKNP